MPGPLLPLSRGIDRLTSAIGAAVTWLTLLMVLIGAFNATVRYASRFTGVNLSSNTFIELQWYLFSAVFLLGAAATLRRDRHVRVDVLFGRLGDRARAGIDIAGGLLFLLPFCVFGVWTSIPMVVDSWAVWEASPDPGGLPRWPIKTLIPVAFALLGLQGISEIIRRIAALRGVADGE